MALLLMVQQHLTPGQSLTALTVDHALRKGSAAEARQVKEWCGALGIKHLTLKWKHEAITSGLQAKARAARYDLMTGWCRKNGATALLTAHTKEDQAETVAMRGFRTQSAKSLAGIWPETEMHGVKIWRPLLSFTRNTLRKFLMAQDQQWLEDPSNSDPRFERVRLRQSGISNKLADIASRSQRKVRTAKTKAETWVSKHTRQDLSGMVEFAPMSFAVLSEEAKDEALVQLIQSVGGVAPERAKRQAMLKWIALPSSPRRSLGGAIFGARKGKFVIGREPSRIVAGTPNLSPTRAILWDNRFWVTGPKGSTVTSKAKVKSLKRIKQLPAFIDLGLPVILADDQVLATPFFSHHPKAKVILK